MDGLGQIITDLEAEQERQRKITRILWFWEEHQESITRIIQLVQENQDYFGDLKAGVSCFKAAADYLEAEIAAWKKAKAL